MTQLRWTLFLLICAGSLFYFSRQEQQQAKARQALAAKLKAERIDKEQKELAEKKAADEKAGVVKADDKAKTAPARQDEQKAADNPQPRPKPVVDNKPELIIPLGLDEDFGKYRMLAHVSTKGAVVKDLTLLKDVEKRLRERYTLLHDGASYRMELDGEDLGGRNWDVVDAETKLPETLVLRTTARNGTVEVVKRFSLAEGSYLVSFELQFRNLSDKVIDGLSYTLGGPENIPIEGAWYTQYFRNAASLLVPEHGAPYLDQQLASTIAATGKGQTLVATPVRFSGVAVQYFASVVVQDDDPLERRFFQQVLPIKLPPILDENDRQANEPNHANLTVQFNSTPIKLDANGVVVQKFHLFNGPKERDLLETAELKVYGLDKLIVYMGFFGMRFDSLSNGMVWLVNKIAKVTHDYGLAIILLTLMVRIVIFPLSFKQAATMQRATEKMQVIQPKMQEIREKYANDARKMNQELMELYRKHDYNPASMFGGCLLVFLQMPIFVALYQALQGSFDLRQQPFHFTWIHDLAAPDQLFHFGFQLPLLGAHFNLLPFISLGMMISQILLAPTPPAATPELAEQQKMSKRMTAVMMIFIGYMFYNVPAGLCLYIITSTAWGFLERKFIKKKHPPGAATAAPTAVASTNGAAKNEISWKSPIDKKKKR